MKTAHTITFCDHSLNWVQRRRLARRLADIGVSLNDVPLARFNFEICEEDERYSRVAELQAKYESVDICRTSFSPEELAGAAYVRMVGSWLHGYPMPDDDFGYRDVTYDVSHYCPDCGIGARQREPFRVRAEPKWGRKSLMQLNWVFDEFFVTPSLYRACFEKHGIGCLEVLHHRTLKPLQTVVQLVIDATAPSALALPENSSQTCRRCGRRKHLPSLRGEFPGFIGNAPATHLARTQEYFGDGAAADRAVLVSHDLYRALAEAQVRGVEFQVVSGKPGVERTDGEGLGSPGAAPSPSS